MVVKKTFRPDRPAMRDPDIGLHTEFLPLYARVPIDRLARAYGWAVSSDHPECRYAVWDISRNYALISASKVRHGHPAAGRNFRHLGVILRMFEEYGGGAALTEPDFAAFHCSLTKAGAASVHAEAQMLTYRILKSRAARPLVSCQTEADDLSRKIFHCTGRLESVLKEDFRSYPVPGILDLFTGEEIVCREALRWAGAQPPWSPAYRLFNKLLIRTDKTNARNESGRPRGTRTRQRIYVNRSPACYEIARLYLEAQSR
jgi:hypothetical protein